MTPIPSASRWSQARAALCAPGLALLLAGLVLGWISMPTRAQQVDLLKEAQVKAGYLVNFLRYTSFPDRSGQGEDGSWRIMVLGDEPLHAALEAAARADLRVHDRALRVLPVESPVETAAGGLPALDLLYVAGEVSGQQQQRLRALSGVPVLTVGDGEDFIEQGGMLRLRLEDGRIVFDANLDALRAARLGMSAKALKLARRLHPEPAP